MGRKNFPIQEILKRLKDTTASNKIGIA